VAVKNHHVDESTRLFATVTPNAVDMGENDCSNFGVQPLPADGLTSLLCRRATLSELRV
jgi:hypothetical protein